LTYLQENGEMKKLPQEPQQTKLSKIDIRDEETVDRKVDNLLHNPPNPNEESLNDLDEEISKGE
jgi:hypothetical protein